MKILITGVTGLIGQQLAIELMTKQHSVYGLSRGPTADFLPQGHYIQCDLEQKIPLDKIKGFDVIVHLAGFPVADQRWSQDVKNKIYSSRIQATKKLVGAINSLSDTERPKHFISGSAIGIYGESFLFDIVNDWEKEARNLKNTPLSILRTGIVLSQHGGALSQMPPVIVGSGRMIMSWIHIADWISACQKIIEKQWLGVFNMTAPQPVSQKSFIKALVTARKYPLPLYTPQGLLKVALGERAEVLFESLNVIPEQLLNLNFKFRFNSINDALNDIYRNQTWLDHCLYKTQFIAKDRNTVFDFFSQAENLERITPDFLSFKIVDKSTEKIQKNTEINYRLKLHGLKIKWKTLISRWSVPEEFIDEQIKGPYSKWVHLHKFYDVEKGTLITDQVIYRLPLGPLGLIGHFKVKKDINQIFNYRKKIISEVFPQNEN